MSRLLFFLVLVFLIFSCGKRKKIITVHPDGYYKEVYHVIDDTIKDGPYLKYFESGMLADSYMYVNNTIHGIRKIYSVEGNLEIEETYNKGTFHGPYKTYYPNGQVKKIQEYVNNKIEGDVKQFYEDGTLKAVIHFSDNLENGPFTEYHPNGKIHWKGFYERGDYEQDTLIEYGLNGELVRKMYCEQGICQTIWTPEKGDIELREIFVDE